MLTKFQRIWLLVDVKSEDECWLWLGKLNNSGYGQHRKIYEKLNGPVSSDRVVMHLCNNRACCNPAHLRVGTQVENLKYMKLLGRRDNRKISLTLRATKKGSGVQYNKRNNIWMVMFKVLGRPLYISSHPDEQLARDLAKAALDEVKKLLLTHQFISYEDIKRHFHANA